MKSPRFCKELARLARKLEREFGELPSRDRFARYNVLRTVMAWKLEQYRQTDHVDRFEQPWLVELLDVHRRPAVPSSTACSPSCTRADQPVAAQFGLRTETLLVGWFTRRRN